VTGTTNAKTPREAKMTVRDVGREDDTEIAVIIGPVWPMTVLGCGGVTRQEWLC